MADNKEDVMVVPGATTPKYSPEQYAAAIQQSRNANMGLLEREYDKAVQEQNTANTAYQKSLGDLIQMYAPAETQEQRMQRERNDRAKMNIAFASDVIGGIGNMFTAAGKGGRSVKTPSMTEAVTKGITTREEREKQRRTDYSNLVTNYQRARKESADTKERNAYNALRQAQQNQLYYDRIAATADENEKKRVSTSEEKEKDRISRENIAAGQQGVTLHGQNLRAGENEDKDERAKRDALIKQAEDIFKARVNSLKSIRDNRGIKAEDYEKKVAKAEEEYEKTINDILNGKVNTTLSAAGESSSSSAKPKRSFKGKPRNNKDY